MGDNSGLDLAVLERWLGTQSSIGQALRDLVQQLGDADDLTYGREILRRLNKEDSSLEREIERTLKGHSVDNDLAKTPLQFMPWFGQSYSAGIEVGDGHAARRLKLLILGESHYGAPKALGFTRYILRSQWGDESVKAGAKIEYFRRIAELVVGSTRLEADGLENFYQSVAFYNYVQESMATSSQRPTAPQYEAGYTAFLKVADALQPDLILVTGFTLWDHLPDYHADTRPDGLEKLPQVPQRPVDSTRRLLEIWRLRGTRDCQPMVFPVCHPSARSFAGVTQWRPWIRSGIEAAVRFANSIDSSGR
jgi:hypothetical protein